MLTIYKKIIFDEKNKRFKLLEQITPNKDTLSDIIVGNALYIVNNHCSASMDFCVLYSEFEDKDNLYYDYNHGTYLYLLGDQTKYDNIGNILTKGRNKFPYYTLHREYSSYNFIKNFARVMTKTTPLNNKTVNAFKYTFGIEYETSAGFLPEKECYKNGLIPLRDGSISAVEYATIVLNASKGFKIIPEQLKQLKKYTEFDKECSLHMHFGAVPVDLRFAYILYQICFKLQSELVNLMPKYTFTTSLYKNSQKDYCKLLPAVNNFKQLISFIYYCDVNALEEVNLNDFSMYAEHPSDPTGNAKWHIQSRYYWLNLVNLLCYNKAKTVEFRFLRPTYNKHVIINWLYVFNAIISYAEKIFNEIHNLPYNQVEQYCIERIINHTFDLYSIIENKYSFSAISRRLNYFLVQIAKVTQIQTSINDFIGENTAIEDIYINQNVLS